MRHFREISREVREIDDDRRKIKAVVELIEKLGLTNRELEKIENYCYRKRSSITNFMGEGIGENVPYHEIGEVDGDLHADNGFMGEDIGENVEHPSIGSDFL